MIRISNASWPNRPQESQKHLQDTNLGLPHPPPRPSRCPRIGRSRRAGAWRRWARRGGSRSSRRSRRGGGVRRSLQTRIWDQQISKLCQVLSYQTLKMALSSKHIFLNNLFWKLHIFRIVLVSVLPTVDDQLLNEDSGSRRFIWRASYSYWDIFIGQDSYSYSLLRHIHWTRLTGSRQDPCWWTPRWQSPTLCKQW